VYKGQKIQVFPITENRQETVAENIDFGIAYEDEDLLIVDKPSGLVVHPGHGNPTGTLLNGLLYYLPSLNNLPRGGLIHRLDKDTSGLLVVAKTSRSYTQMVSALEKRKILREYRAICVGTTSSGGKIDANIARDTKNRIKFAISKNGKHALTHFRVLKKFEQHTYIGLRLDTGRTHQIRVHMAHIKYPLLGDPLYGKRLIVPRGANKTLQSKLQQFKRQALHANKIRFNHPISLDELTIKSKIPEDILSILITLSNGQIQREDIESLKYPEI
jgi:23S rRNA pseudouridine1911/1915/1917 synthase